MLIVHNFKPAPAFSGDYAEASYFDGYHFQHIAAYYDALRLKRKRTEAIKALDRRTSRR